MPSPFTLAALLLLTASPIYGQITASSPLKLAKSYVGEDFYDHFSEL